MNKPSKWFARSLDSLSAARPHRPDDPEGPKASYHAGHAKGEASWAREPCPSADQASIQNLGRPAPLRPSLGDRGYSLTLRQTCSWPEPRAQFAFKDSMIHVQCRSHYVSHFAAFFIVARAKISVVESCLGSLVERYSRSSRSSTPKQRHQPGWLQIVEPPS